MTTIELTGAEEVTWDLSDLYVSGEDSRLESDLAEAAAAAGAFRDRYYGAVATLSATELGEAVNELERIESIATRAVYFAHMRFSTNMADQSRGALVAKLGEQGAELETTLLFFGLEWAAIEDGPAAELLADPVLDHWRHWLGAQRVFRPYLLTEPEEKLITEKAVSGVSAWSRLYEEVLGAMRVELDGNQVSLETAMARMYSSDRDKRRGAAEAVTHALEPALRTRTSIFNTLLQDKAIDDRLRGYPSWISARNLGNRTTDAAVQSLVDAAVSRYDLPQRYYTLKAKLLGLDRLAFYDRFAPVAEDASKTSWDAARRVVTEAYSDFSAEAGAAVSGFFTSGWIDGPVRPDKRHGAYCATTVPGVHPYVFMNYTGDRRSILTLAHELGHALHGTMAQPLGLFNASTPLTTAETASVFGEALTFKRMLQNEANPRRRLDLLTGRIEDAIATTFRQISMNRFEEAVHTERRTKGELSTDRINELWLERQTALFGDSVSLDGYETWWSYIPHFTNSPGYVYAYAYGYLFALSIFRSYEREGDAIVEPYLDLLRAGGSKSPEELARMVGLDLTDPSIWASGIEALSDELDEAERLAAEIGLG